MKSSSHAQSVNRRRYAITLFILTALFLMAIGAINASAQSQTEAAAYYKGKNLNFIVPYKPGGGYDTYSRILRPYLEKHTGARVVVRNVPGAGGLLGVNETFTASPNGLTIGIQNAVASVTNQMSEIEGVRYDFTKFSWIGRMATNVRALAVRKGSSYKTIQDLLNSKEKVKMGATGLGGSTYVDAVITMKALGFPAEIIHGYDSSKEMDMGMLRGEIEILWGSYSSRRKMVKAGEQFIILQSGKKRASAIPDVPTWFEVAPSEKAKQILTVLTAMHETGRPIAGPPGIAPERLEFLRQAFYKAMHDPDFLKDAKKAKRVLSYLPGEDMAQLAKESMIIEDANIKQLFVDAIKGSI